MRAETKAVYAPVTERPVTAINVHRPYAYLDAFVRLSKVGAPMVEGRQFSNAKEVTETMAAFSAATKVLGDAARGDASILALDIGSGKTPRTAEFVARSTLWRAIAIDPRLGNRPARHERVELRRSRIEDTSIVHDGTVVALCVHAHAPLGAVLGAIRAPRLLVVAIPCCEPYDMLGGVEWDDYACLSPQRRVKVWVLEPRDAGGRWATRQVLVRHRRHELSSAGRQR